MRSNANERLSYHYGASSRGRRPALHSCRYHREPVRPRHRHAERTASSTRISSSPTVAVALDIGPTVAHYHNGFDEIYFVLDGDLVVQTYDPASGKTSQQKLAANELWVVTKGVHHKITASSDKNRLCVIAVPNFDPHDEHISDVLDVALTS
jgi:mannose-6-phosphate isomerase-like protein (cupin superfamily)